MDGKGPVKVVVRKTGCVPGAKSVDLDSLRRIIEKTQRKQLSSSQFINSHPVSTDPEARHPETSENDRIKPDSGVQNDNRRTAGLVASYVNNAGVNSPSKFIIKREPVENNSLDNAEHLLNNSDEFNDSDGQLPVKRPKVVDREGDDAKSNYSCCFCQFTTKSAKDYRSHIASHLKNKVLNCNSCPFSTDKISAYNDHVRLAHTVKRKGSTFFHCAVCSFKATKIEALQRHRTATGHTSHRPVQKCKLCRYTDRDVYKMLLHIATHKPDEQLGKKCDKCENPGGMKASEKISHSDQCPEKMFPIVNQYEETVERIGLPKTFSCTLCDFGSEEMLFLVEHVKAHAKLSTDRSGEVTNDLPFGCTMCDYRCSRPNKLVLHMKMHDSGDSYRCKSCPFECTDFQEFKCHQKVHVGVTAADGSKIFSCFICLMRFANQEGLQSHMTTHSKQKPFSCHLCEFKCVSKDTLLQHLKNHSKMKKTMVFFPCPLCPNKYSTSASLRTHLSNHNTDTKPYQCDFCDYSCYTSELLRVHVQKHSGSNRFRCEICLLNYPSEAKLKAHIRDHLTFDKPLKCSICCTSFSSQAQLNRHLPIHSGRADPFVCFACPQSFPTLKSRRSHMMASHKIANEDEWKAQQPIVVRPAGTGQSDVSTDKYGYVEEDVADESDSEEEDVHPGQHQFIGYPAMDVE